MNRRQVFEPNKIKELAESIHEHGLLQPIVVRPIEEDMFRNYCWRAPI